MNLQLKSIIGLATWMCLLLSFCIYASGRTRTSLNTGWRFAKSDVSNASASNLDDSLWQRINIPHTWNVDDPWDDEPGYYRGAGWYRRAINIPRAQSGRSYFLYFEGANQVAEIYVNGVKAGSHTGGYSAFAFDVTRLLTPGRNIVSVRVDNSFNENIPPLTADFNFYGGIYRDVWLIETSDVHFDVTDYASPGVRITTPNIAAGKGTVLVDGKIAGKLRDVVVMTTIVDAENRWVNTTNSRTGDDGTFSHLLEVPKPKLWSPDSPYLYTARLSIREKDGRVLDEISQPLGFRWFSFDGETGFHLNGKPLRLVGTNRHQDYKGLGNAVPDRLHVRDMEIIKAAGFNFVRLAHYPQDPSVLEACDRLGLLVWEETPIVNYITKSAEFSANAATMVREMVRQHRNHPSVILWGYMNEIFLRVPKGRDDLYPATAELGRALNGIAKLEDPTRPTTIAFHGNDVYNSVGLGAIPDVIGWNLYQGWYSATVEDFGKFLDDQHRRFPKRPMIVSEYGANGDQRLRSNQTRRFDSTTDYQRFFHESYLAQMKARPYLSGSAIWNEFDFGAELRGETIPHLNQKGMYTYDRKPKDVHFFYKAQLTRRPFIHIASTDHPVRSGPEGESQPIDVYTNCGSVDLRLNGRTMGSKSVDGDRKASWDVVFAPGVNRLIATSPKCGGSAPDSSTIMFRPVTVRSSEIAINVGSNADFTDGDGRIWIADQSYVKGSWGFTGAKTKRIYSSPPDANVVGTDSDPLFQTMLEGLELYRIDVPDGLYEVELLFGETRFQDPDKRNFDVRINGEAFVDALDLVAQVGRNCAFRSSTIVHASDGINIQFVARIGEPVLSGILVRRK